MNRKRVLIGLSGGIDSSMAAFLLQKQNYEVQGINFHFCGEQNTKHRERIEHIARQLNISVEFYDAGELFKKEVIEFYLETHLKGLTPSPCIYCNPNVKWHLLNKLAAEYHCTKIATGHYVRILNLNEETIVLKGSDKAKDQSYYLWKIPVNIFKKSLTPLGDYTKEEIKLLAYQSGFIDLLQNKESSGLCFTKKKNCEEILDEISKDLKKNIKQGIVLDKNNSKIGTHNGYVYYTIGQKKGLKLNIPEKLCVSKIDPEHNLLWADTWQNLYKKEFRIKDCNFLVGTGIKQIDDLNIKVRGFGLNPKEKAKLLKRGNDQYLVQLTDPAWAVAPGQSVVFYSGDMLIGGGIIE